MKYNTGFSFSQHFCTQIYLNDTTNFADGTSLCSDSKLQLTALQLQPIKISQGGEYDSSTSYPLYQEFITQPPNAPVSLLEKCCSYPNRCICVLSCVWLFATSWTPAFQASLSMEFSTQEYWNGLPFPTPGDLPDPGIKSVSPALADRFGFFTMSHLGRPSPKVRGTKIMYVVITLISHSLKISSWCDKKKKKV